MRMNGEGRDRNGVLDQTKALSFFQQQFIRNDRRF